MEDNSVYATIKVKCEGPNQWRGDISRETDCNRGRRGNARFTKWGGQLAFIRWVHNREGHTENKTGGPKQQSTAAAASDIDTAEERVVLTAK